MPGDKAETGDDETPAADDGASDGLATDDGGADALATGGDGADVVGTDGSATDDDGFEVTRRKAVVGGLGLFVGAGVGVGATLATTDSDEIRKQKPNSDGKGTLGELRWVMEEKHGLAVTSMVRAESTVRVEYESAATSRAESRREIGHVVSAYGLIVASDGPTEKLSADVERGFDEQATSYHVQAEWVKRWRSGDLSDAGVVQRVFNTRRFPEGSQ